MEGKAKIGLASIGLDTYWGQFTGLYDRLCGYKEIIKNRIDSDIIDAGMVDNPEKAAEAAVLFESNCVDLIFVYISTYALSSTVLPLAQRTKAHVVLLNVQPTAAMDYDYINGLDDKTAKTGQWLANCQACSTPEIACVFNRAGIEYDIISGHLEDGQTWEEIKKWTEAAEVKAALRDSRLGILGHYYCGMLDVYTDLTRQSAAFGTHIELIEMCKIKELRDNVTDSEIDTKIAEFRSSFKVSADCSDYELKRAAKTAVALDKVISELNLGAMAYYYEGYQDYQDIVTSVIAGNTLLTSKGIPVAGECEVKNAQAMKIMSLFGTGGSFSEFYGMDFNDDVVLLGHDGPAHTNISEKQVELVPLPVYHGKPGCGLSIQMTVKHGNVTLLSVCEDKNDVFLLVAEGKSVPGPVLNIGNTNSRYKFDITAKEFINKWSAAGPSHHCAIGVGHIADKIETLGRLLHMRVVRIC